jgi:hypothetical protein
MAAAKRWVVGDVGVRAALAVNATSFLISAALIWGMKLPARSRAQPGVARWLSGRAG